MTCADPRAMLLVVAQSGPTERKIRLFNVAICRRFWGYLSEALRAILSESELLADGLARASSGGLCRRANAAVALFDRQYPTKQFPSAEIRIQRDAAAAVCYAVLPDQLFGAANYFWDIDLAENGPHSSIIRDIFGNPFRQSPPPPCAVLAWNDGTVRRIAEGIYEERAFDRLLILHDALLDAGCNEEDILAHCRSEGPHVRGCWVIDLILGKS
jgi:hypothetical protein